MFLRGHTFAVMTRRRRTILTAVAGLFLLSVPLYGAAAQGRPIQTILLQDMDFGSVVATSPTGTVTLYPTTQNPQYNGVLSTGGPCGDISVIGTAADVTPGAECDVNPVSVAFGDVELGKSTDKTFTIHNIGAVEFSGSVSSPCTDFSIVSGGGAYALLPGDSVNVSVRFAPTTIGATGCAISTGVNCGQVTATGTGAPGTATTSYGNDIQPIFNASCAIRGCHVAPSPQVGLDLSVSVSFASLVGVTSAGYAPAIRVVPGDPGSSVLYNKVAVTGAFGGPMPPGGGLSAQQVGLIRSWILDGAPNN